MKLAISLLLAALTFGKITMAQAPSWSEIKPRLDAHTTTLQNKALSQAQREAVIPQVNTLFIQMRKLNLNRVENLERIQSIVDVIGAASDLDSSYSLASMVYLDFQANQKLYRDAIRNLKSSKAKKAVMNLFAAVKDFEENHDDPAITGKPKR